MKLFLKKLNSLHEKISFTREVEENNQLPFLDILIISYLFIFVLS